MHLTLTNLITLMRGGDDKNDNKRKWNFVVEWAESWI